MQNALTVFNSTSIAAHMISNHIRGINKQRFYKRELQAGRMTLEEVNQRRA